MSGFKRFGMAAALGATLAAGGIIVRAQQAPGPVERAGEKVDQAGRAIDRAVRPDGPAERAGERIDDAGRALRPGQQEPGAIERAGEKLDEAGRSLRQGLERGFNRTKAAVRETFEATQAKVNDMSIEARVYGRLHWDKHLETSTFDLASEAQGIVTLRGSVPSAEAKKHAVNLAADTVGVTRVIDQLAVLTPAEATDVEIRTQPVDPTVTPTPAPAPKARIRPRTTTPASATPPQD